MGYPQDAGRCSLEGLGRGWWPWFGAMGRLPLPGRWLRLSSSRRVKPSSLCGPFRTLDTMYEAGKVWVHRLERAGPRVSWLPWVHRYLVENTFPVYLVSALLL